MQDGAAAGARPPCMALVPMVTAARWQRISNPQLSLAPFVTHLIATAEHVPQTCSLRRATPADARTAYSTSQHRLHGAGIRPRQAI